MLILRKKNFSFYANERTYTEKAKETRSARDAPFSRENNKYLLLHIKKEYKKVLKQIKSFRPQFGAESL